MSQLSEIAGCTAAAWQPVIGDPTVWGWLTVLAYAASAIGCLWAAKQPAEQRLRLFWFGLALLLALLCVNKQLDLQSALTAFARCAAQIQGWYETRRGIQIAAIGLFALAALLLVTVLSWRLRRDLGKIWPALIGVWLLLSFVLIRAAGFHKVDALINVNVGVIPINAILEMGGIFLIVAGAAAYVRRAR